MGHHAAQYADVRRNAPSNDFSTRFSIHVVWLIIISWLISSSNKTLRKLLAECTLECCIGSYKPMKAASSFVKSLAHAYFLFFGIFS